LWIVKLLVYRKTIPRDTPTHPWNRSGTVDLSGRKFIRTISGSAEKQQVMPVKSDMHA